MGNASLEKESNVVKKLVDNWDANGLAFFMALVSAIAFCFASILSEDELSVLLQLFGIGVTYMMMWKLPVYYIAEKKGFSDKSSASLGLTVCFTILIFLLTIGIEERSATYYFGIGITLLFALLMVWRMNMKDSKVNVRKTFTACIVALLVQSVLSAIMFSNALANQSLQIGTQLAFGTILLIYSAARLIHFLRNRDILEAELE